MFLMIVVILLILIHYEENEGKKHKLHNILHAFLVMWLSLALIAALVIATVGFLV